jgi:hypothetical protein
VADVRCRGYSLPLQQAITDFGADNAFGRVGAKLKEHYGIAVPLGAAATITERHAHALSDADTTPATSAVKPLILIVEVDGSMIPVVEIGPCTPEEPDKRKHRTLLWKEARLSLVRRPDEVEPSFDVTLGDVATTGAALKRLAVAAGLKPRTAVHGVGDGAPWIAEQIEIQFGAQGNYLIDFFHVCDYLAAAAPICAPDQPGQWLICQKERLKTGQLAAVKAELAAHVEAETVANDQAPVRACYRYLINRPGQFKYREAIDRQYREAIPLDPAKLKALIAMSFRNGSSSQALGGAPPTRKPCSICESCGPITAGSVTGMPPPRNTAQHFRLHPVQT